MEKYFSIKETLRKLENHELSGRTLSKEVRLEIIGLLKSEGWKTVSVASLLGYTPRQVRRFLSEIRKENSAKFTTDFCREHIGSFLQKTESASEFLIRTYHDSNQPIKSRIAGSVAVLKYANDTMSTLKKLGMCVSANPEERNVERSKIGNLEEPALSKQDQKIMEEYKKLPPMEREKLIERLYRDINAPLSEDNLL